MIPSKIWAHQQENGDGHGTWYSTDIGTSGAPRIYGPYYHIPDELIELGKRYIENGEYRDGDKFVDGILAIIGDQ